MLPHGAQHPGGMAVPAIRVGAGGHWPRRTSQLAPIRLCQHARGTTGAREASEPWWRGRRTRSFVVGAKDDSDEVAALARGRETSKLEDRVSWRLLRHVEACAPSTTLLRRVV